MIPSMASLAKLIHNKVANNDSLPAKIRYNKKGNESNRYKLMALGRFQMFSFWGDGVAVLLMGC
jgi:hypothetical protein